MIETRLSVDFDWRRIESSDEDLQAFDRARAMRILSLTILIREFEEQLLVLKSSDCVWGPVHSSIGQEALAAATMAGLRPGDSISGSHRAHHQFIAKAFLHAVGPDWDPLSREVPAAGAEVVRRTLAEIMGLRTGYCGGRGGSMHLRSREAGVLGTNAIVGGGIPLATGAAFAEKFLSTGRIVACFFGDGAVNQGSFHEAANLAGLWKLPVIYVVENNLYAVATRSEDACAVSDLSQRAYAYAMDGRIVDGSDVVAIHHAVQSAAEGLRTGTGRPCIIEVKCYRNLHHAGDQLGSAFGYRSREEEAQWRLHDALTGFPRQLERLGLLSPSELATMREAARGCVAEAVAACTTQGTSGLTPRDELWPDTASVATGARSTGGELDGLPYAEPEQFPETRKMTYVQAISAVTGRWMEMDPTVIAIGEEVANFGGGAYSATRGLPARFPRQVINTPISEAGFVGLACGAAMNGLKPVVEILFPDFALVAADQLFNQIGKARHMYGNTTDLPLLARTRVAIGLGYGGQHSLDPAALFALFPGWRIVAPSNAFDYIGLFNTAMHSRDPVLVIEHHSLYPVEFPVPAGSLDYCVPFGKARIAREGTDVTVLVYGAMCRRVGAAAEVLGAGGVSAEIVDLRTLDLPAIDYGTICASVAKTGALVVIEEAAASQTIGPRIVAELTRRSFDRLDCAPVFLSSRDVPPSVSRVLEDAAIIGNREIIEGIQRAAQRQS